MPDQANRLFLHEVPEPPVAHAYHHWDDERRVLSYTYNGRYLLRVHIPGTSRVSFRHGSDGALQSFPLHQQVFIALTGEATTATVTFQMSGDSVNMRPRRAGAREAVLGQVGRPLLPGVNGLYDIAQDLMVSWHGRAWRWLDDALHPDVNGNLIARMEVELDSPTWTVSLKPHYYRTHLGYHYHAPWRRRPKLKPIVGWCTWEAYRRDLSEEKIARSTRFFAEKLRKWGFEYIQVDDGYEKLPLPVNPHGDLGQAWLETRDEFPTGHAGIVSLIRAHGLEPGIWTSAAIYNDDFADAQPGCLLKDRDGQPLLGDWVKYVLDCTPAALERHVRPVYEGLRAAGYSYCKIDAIRHLLYDGMHEGALLGLLSNEEAEHRFRRFLEVAREGLGKDVYWLSSWGVMTQMVGLCDACRISQDAMPTWSGMQMQLVESARWLFAQRVLWLNDPDHVCVRAPLEWSRTVLSLVALSGGLFMLSDAIEEYDEQRLALIRKCIPPLTTVAGETGPLDADYAAFTWTKFHGFQVLEEKPFAVETMTDEEARNQAGAWATGAEDHPFSTLWAVHLDLPIGRWCVVGRFASIALRASRLDLNDVGLAADADYLAYDFWNERFLGRVRTTCAVPALPLGHCQVLALRPACDHPQLLSSTRHVSQDAISVRRQAWASPTLSLQLTGPAGSSETYTLHVPHGYVLKNLEAANCDATPLEATTIDQDTALPIRVAFSSGTGDTVEATLTLNFFVPTTRRCS